MIANLGKEELDKMCQEMSDCIENNTFHEEKKYPSCVQHGSRDH